VYRGKGDRGVGSWKRDATAWGGVPFPSDRGEKKRGYELRRFVSLYWRVVVMRLIKKPRSGGSKKKYRWEGIGVTGIGDLD